VTFDDAYRSVLSLALPILEALELPGTVFVPTRFAIDGRLASWPGMEADLAGPHADELKVMSWDELAQLNGRGWEVGSHTQTHARLTELADRELREQLVGSRRECEQRLGIQCTSLAYPYGDTDTRVMAAAAAAGYTAGAGLPVRRLHAPLALNWPRVGIYGADRRWRFELKTSRAARRLRTFATTPARSAPSRSAFLPHAEMSTHAPNGARIAVIVPCFNDGELALDAVGSIEESEPVEVVVIDDASTEPRTLSALQSLRRAGVQVLRHERNLGLPAARVSGLQATTAKYVFPLDADDLVVPGALSSMAAVLDATPAAAVCFGDYAEFGTRDRTRRVPVRLDPYRVAYRNDYPVSSLFRRSVLESVGGWQAVGAEVGYEDWNLWMTLAERGAVGIHWGNGVAVRRRLHGNRMLADAAKRHISLYATLRTLHPRLFADLRAHRCRCRSGRSG
jgi:peptidoglycan/xylan/chitin deacetylase (PgdA/CDA1 family)